MPRGLVDSLGRTFFSSDYAYIDYTPDDRPNKQCLVMGAGKDNASLVEVFILDGRCTHAEIEPHRLSIFACGCLRSKKSK